MLNTCISCSRQEIRLWAQLDDFINQIWLWQFHFKTKNLLGFQLCMLTFLFYMLTKMNFVWRCLNVAGIGVKNWNKI